MHHSVVAQIPLSFRQTWIDFLTKCFKTISNLTGNRNKYRKEAKESRKTLLQFGKLPHGNYKKTSKSLRTLYNRFENMTTSMNYHDTTINECISLASYWALAKVSENKCCQQILNEQYSKLWIRDHNYLMKNVYNDNEYVERIFFSGWLQGWKNSDYAVMNKTVCMLFVTGFAMVLIFVLCGL